MDPHSDLCMDSRVAPLCVFSSCRSPASTHSKRAVYCAGANQSAHRLGQPCYSCQPRQRPENLRHHTGRDCGNGILCLFALGCSSCCIPYYPQRKRRPVVRVPGYLGADRSRRSQHPGTTKLRSGSHLRMCRTCYPGSSVNGTTKGERIAPKELIIKPPTTIISAPSITVIHENLQQAEDSHKQMHRV